MPNSVVNFAGGVIQTDSSASANAISQRDSNGDIYYRDTYATRRRPASATSGSTFTAIVSKTANYTATDTDSVILCDATGGAITITLPAAASSTGLVLSIIKTDSSSNGVVIDGASSETVNGSTTKTTTTQYGGWTIACNGTAWYIIV